MLTEHAYISGGYVDIYESSGAPTRTRTADLLITNQLLYQLSYRGSERRFRTKELPVQALLMRFCQKKYRTKG